MIAGNVRRVWDAWKKERAAETAGNSADSSEARPDAAAGNSADSPDAGANAAAAGLRILISAPEGEALAERTFNPKLGIVGGISILGTTGIVEPMSDHAVVETIRAQLSVLKAEGRRYAVMAPGNYGLAFLTQQYGLQEEKVVLISNYAAEAVQLAAEAGFEGILLAGHIGKLVKIAGGARNTHSLYGDRRMEVLWEIARDLCREEDRDALQRELADCVMTDAALQVLDRYGVKEKAAREMAGRICHYLGEWSGGRLRTETIVFSNRGRELVRTQGALELLGGELS
jgi:cobalt-precorrin-5B (C1)-methyltransferase